MQRGVRDQEGVRNGTRMTIGPNKWCALRRGVFWVTCFILCNRTKKATASVRPVTSVRS